MDKLPKGEQKITVKINGEEKEYREDLPIHNWQDVTKEIAAARQENTDDASSMAHNLDLLRKKKLPSKKRINLKNKSKNGRKTRYPNPTVIAAAASAIMIGVLIGVIFLQVMKKDVETSTPADPTTGDNPQTEQPVTAEQTVIPQFSIFFIQEGVYQNEESVTQHVADLNANGKTAGYIKSGDNLHVLTAMIADIDKGKEMLESPLYADMWPKELAIGEKIIQNLTSDEKQFFESAFSFYEMLVNEGTKAYIQGDKFALDEKNLNDSYSKLEAYEKIEKQEINELKDSLSGAYNALMSYFQTRKEENWLQAQTHLINFVTGYYSL